MPKAIGAMHLSNSKNFEAQRVNNFEVTFEGLDDDFVLSVESFPLPSISTPPIVIAHGNSKIKVAGQSEVEDGELTIVDYVTADIEDKMYQWQKKVYDPETDKIGWAADYKRNGTVYQYAPDGTHVRTWTIKGAWPSSVKYGDMNNETSETKKISATISYDKAYRNEGTS
jgi:hypothetical protein